MGRKITAGQRVGDMEPLRIGDLQGLGIASHGDVAAAVATVVAVTEVDTGTGLTGGPITATGTIAIVVPVSVTDGGTGDTTFAAHGVIVGAGTGPLGVTGTGTPGQVLTSNGPTADPTFQAAGGGSSFKDWRPMVNGTLPGAIMFDANGAVIAVFI